MSTLGTYLLYYFIVISSSIIAWFSNLFKKGRIPKWIFFSAIIIPVVISGFRNGVGTDFDNYVKIYDQLYYQYPSIFSAIIDSRFEPGWVILNYLVRYIFDDVQFLFIITALLTWTFSFKAIYDNKKYISVGLSVLILLCTLYNMSFNIVRQILAVSIIMLSIKPMLDNRKWKFILIVLFASSFHYSALIFLPAYWIVDSKTEDRGLLKRIFIPLLAIGFVFLFQPIFSFLTNNIDAFSAYSLYSIEFSGFSIPAILLKLPVVLLIIINYKKLKAKNNIMHKLSILYIIGLILTLLSSYSPYLNRVSFFYDVTQVFIVPAIIKAQTNKYEKFLYTYVIVIYYLARFTYFYLFMGDGGTIPYNF